MAAQVPFDRAGELDRSVAGGFKCAHGFVQIGVFAAWQQGFRGAVGTPRYGRRADSSVADGALIRGFRSRGLGHDSGDEGHEPIVAYRKMLDVLED